MSYPTLVETTALESLLGVTFDAADSVRAVEVLRIVSASVRRAARQTWVDDEGDIEEVPEDVRGLVLEAAATLWVNPTGVSYQSAGPFAANFTDPLSEDERTRLRHDYAEGQVGGLGTISTTRGPVETTPAWGAFEW